MPFSIRIIRELEELDPKLRNVFFIFLEEIEKNVNETVKRSDFLELTQVVMELKFNDIAKENILK